MLLDTRSAQRTQVDDTYQAANLEARDISAWFGDHARAHPRGLVGR
jgi:hypothetical protein